MIHKTQSADPQNIQDVIVIGSGLVGGLTALLLPKSLKTTILEAGIAPSSTGYIQKDSRVLAINEASRKIYTQAGVWQKLLRFMPYVGMQVWNENGKGQIEFGNTTSLINMDAQAGLGTMVEPKVLNQAIADTLQENPHIKVQYGCIVKNLTKYANYWEVELATTEKLYTKLLVGADGAHSFVKRQLGIVDAELDYDQIALTCAIKTQLPHQQIAKQIFWSTGPIGILPMAVANAAYHQPELNELLSNGLASNQTDQMQWSSVVWTVPKALATKLVQLDDEQFKIKLQQAMQYTLGSIEVIESRAFFPLKARAPKNDIGDQAVLIGDAAHVIHPLAGQGVNLGVLDAAILAEYINIDKKHGLAPSQYTLQQYSMARRVHTRAMMHSMSIIGWFQQNTNPTFIWIRSEGVQWLQNLPLIRKKLTEIASGMNVLKGTSYYN